MCSYDPKVEGRIALSAYALGEIRDLEARNAQQKADIDMLLDKLRKLQRVEVDNEALRDTIRRLDDVVLRLRANLHLSMEKIEALQADADGRSAYGESWR